jgi:hypothetical protein
MPCARAGSRSRRTEPSTADAFGSSVLARRLIRCRTKASGALVLAWRVWAAIDPLSRSRRKSILGQYGSAMARGGATRLPCGHVDRRVSTGDLHPRRPVPPAGRRVSSSGAGSHAAAGVAPLFFVPMRCRHERASTQLDPRKRRRKRETRERRTLEIVMGGGAQKHQCCAPNLVCERWGPLTPSAAWSKVRLRRRPSGTIGPCIRGFEMPRLPTPILQERRSPAYAFCRLDLYQHSSVPVPEQG